MPVGLVAAFLAGTLSISSPCVLPLVPVYLAHLAGVGGTGKDPDRRTVLIHALAFRPQEEAQANPDVLDAQIRSEKSLMEVQKNASSISLRWTIVTRIRTEDFLEALKASRVAH